MQSMLYETKPSLRQLYLDPRTKIILCLTTSFLMFSGNYVGVMRYLLPILAVFPVISLLILKKPGSAVFYAATYVICLIIQELLNGSEPAEWKILAAAIASIFMQLLPGLAMFRFLISSTTVSEFIAAMDGFHITKKIAVPVSVMFRFFPAIKEEYGLIRNAMRLRGIGSGGRPLEMLEYRFVPLLTELLKIGNELAASAMTRGLDAPGKRTNVCATGFRLPDLLVFLFCVVVIAAYIYTKVIGK